jgi:hypothetical protein
MLVECTILVKNIKGRGQRGDFPTNSRKIRLINWILDRWEARCEHVDVASCGQSFGDVGINCRFNKIMEYLEQLYKCQVS